eukprot:Seg454.4 transcript_id=Seg454.4/GoldUCD/mRNA.D3Y31 product="Uracil-DNA glycosylase" protein_id=Seg454.4/GoldUCD/D3Y31
MNDDMVLQFLMFTEVHERWEDLILGNANLLRRVKEVLPNLNWKEYVRDKNLAENLLLVIQFFEMNGIRKRLQDMFISDDDGLMAALATVIKEPNWQVIVGNEKAKNLLYVVQFLELNDVSKAWQDLVIHNDTSDELQATLAAILVKEPKWREFVGEERAANLLHILHFCEGNNVRKDWLYWIISNDGLMATLVNVIKNPVYQDIVGTKKAEDLLHLLRFCECYKVSTPWLDWIIKHGDVMAAMATELKKPDWQGRIGEKRAETLLLTLHFLHYTKNIQKWLPLVFENGILMVRLETAIAKWRQEDETKMTQNAKNIMTALHFLVSNGVVQTWENLILHNTDFASSLARVLKKGAWQGIVGAVKAENLLQVVHFCACNGISQTWLNCIIQCDDVMATFATVFTKPQWQGIVEKGRIANLMLIVDFLYHIDDLRKRLRWMVVDGNFMVKMAAVATKWLDEDRIGLSMNAENVLLVLHFLEFNKVKEGWQNLILYNLDLIDSLATILKRLGWDNFMLDKNANYLPNYLPDARSIFKAFSYAEPEKIRVVMIGMSPLADRDLTTGLAFSANCCKEGFLNTGKWILTVHRSLKIAGLLSEDSCYDYSHEDWARNGVLLVNAAFTITEQAGNDIRDDISDVGKHFDIWNEFWKAFLADWIAKCESDHKVFVMCWGSAAVWREMLSLCERETFGKHMKFITLQSDHPTWPGEQGNFLNETPQHFQIINECYPGIFNISKRKTIST